MDLYGTRRWETLGNTTAFVHRGCQNHACSRFNAVNVWELWSVIRSVGGGSWNKIFERDLVLLSTLTSIHLAVDNYNYSKKYLFCYLVTGCGQRCNRPESFDVWRALPQNLPANG